MTSPDRPRPYGQDELEYQRFEHRILTLEAERNEWKSKALASAEERDDLLADNVNLRNELAAHLTCKSELVAERDRLAKESAELREALSNLEEFCATERFKLGAIDGYNYASGQEYGLRLAEIKAAELLAALHQQDNAADSEREQS